jgi:hypothetical protein
LAGERDYNSRIPATLSRLRQILICAGSLGVREIGAVGDRFEHVLMKVLGDVVSNVLPGGLAY